jgi:prevent-host-death family protein
MTTIPATEASRNFSALLDAVERGEAVTITRGGRRIAQIGPVMPRTGRDLRRALEALPPLDESFEDDIEAARAMITGEWADPWREG